MIDTGGADEESISENDEIIRECGGGEGSFPVKNDAETTASCKRIKEIPIDRLSALPESLIIDILNILGLREAGITSVLSKRWQYLWTDLPCLRFEQGEFQSESEFVSWVQRTLILRSLNYVENFEVTFGYEECYASDVTSWIEFAVKNKVKELSLLLQTDTEFYVLPQVIYSASSLTVLSIQRSIVAPHRKIKWECLTKLMIDDVKLHDDLIAQMLASCPVLHELYLTCCWGYNVLETSSPSLSLLWIADCDGEDTGPMLEISAPYIQNLDVWSFPIERKKLCLTNVASLVRAFIGFDLGESSVTVEALNNTMEIFENILHVKELELKHECIEVISELLVTGQLLPQSKRGSLTITTRRYEKYFSSIVGLLESSPNLDKLVIRCYDPSEDSVRTWGPIARADLNCDLLHLKSVYLTDYADPNLGGEPMLTMARIILKRATSLEKMVIEVRKFTRFISSSDFIKMTETVLGYARSSHKAEVVFCR